MREKSIDKHSKHFSPLKRQGKGKGKGVIILHFDTAALWAVISANFYISSIKFRPWNVQLPQFDFTGEIGVVAGLKFETGSSVRKRFLLMGIALLGTVALAIPSPCQTFDDQIVEFKCGALCAVWIQELMILFSILYEYLKA